ncbi:MAG: hypothetical protein H0T89_03375 [Deltaproteobacteria bacterium]|nr:hypothetical protein [Deltaproteobacteria bacterium]MDQ3299745.1 hypothetical protein [Myxococcota bacterium]
MRAAIALLLVVAAGSIASAGPGFDHDGHARSLAGAKTAALACARCHVIKAGLLVGKPDHAACFGSCHGAPPMLPQRRGPLAIAPERVKLCTTCHVESTLKTAKTRKAFAVGFPPYAQRDFVLQVGHKRHAALACAGCHDDKRGGGHRPCASCHDGAPNKGPAMTACSGCHTPATAEADPCADDTNETCRPIRVRAAFSHPKHAARGARCATCHASVVESDARHAPRPSVKACSGAGCHDGAAAFAVTTACTKCHKEVPATKFEVKRPDERFSHFGHLPRLGGTLACASCHALGKTGEVTVTGHAACATCHAEDFHAPNQRTCGACHNATEPWRALVPDAFPPPRSEFGATLDHAKHPAACVSCHTLTTTTAQLRPPRGHRACTGQGCHATTGGPSPTLAACESCHRAGLAEQRRSTRLAAPWSVRARFDHARHQTAPDASPLACTACHRDLRATELLQLATPGKATCAPCHDGQTSFKLSGTGCLRCHGTEAR